MKIAIDIDKTIIDCDSFLYKILNICQFKQSSNNKLRYKVIDNKIIYEENIIRKINKMFNSEYYYVIDDVVQVINELQANGDEIILLSRRPRIKPLINILLICLYKYNINFSKIIIGCNNKAKYCSNNKVELLIDDSYDACINASKEGVNVIVYSKSYEFNNYKRNSSNNFKVAHNWKEIDKYIKELKNQNNKVKICI